MTPSRGKFFLPHVEYSMHVEHPALFLTRRWLGEKGLYSPHSTIGLTYSCPIQQEWTVWPWEELAEGHPVSLMGSDCCIHHWLTRTTSQGCCEDTMEREAEQCSKPLWRRWNLNKCILGYLDPAFLVCSERRQLFRGLRNPSKHQGLTPWVQSQYSAMEPSPPLWTGLVLYCRNGLPMTWPDDMLGFF